MSGKPCPVCCAQEHHVMQKEDGSEGFCNSCGYSWGEGGYDISDERALEHLRIAFALLQEGAKKELERWRNKERAALDLFAVEQAKAEMYKRQMETLAINYTADEKRLRAALADYAMHGNWGQSDYGRDQWSGPEIDGWVIAERALQEVESVSHDKH